MGILPEVSFSWKASESIGITAKLESTSEVFSKNINKDVIWLPEHKRTDFHIYSSYKLNPYWKTSVGYIYLFNPEDKGVHQVSAQLSYKHEPGNIRLGHRIRSDYIFLKEQLPVYRFRYRISAEIPLNGESLDLGEYYLLLSTEPIFNKGDNMGELDARCLMKIGKIINFQHQVEGGIDYRMGDIFSNSTSFTTWVRFGWFIQI